MLEQPEEYLRWILTQVRATDTERIGIAHAFGRALAEPVSAGFDLPLWDASAMDGYAVLASDLASATAHAPVSLRVLGEVAAGSSYNPVIIPGTAVRIMTGAPLPFTADSVVPVELTLGEGNDVESQPVTRNEPGGKMVWADGIVRILGPVPVGANVRQRGEDVRETDVLAQPGDTLGAARLSALAAAGASIVAVHRAPRIAVVSTGSELRQPGEALQRGEIPESNSLLISGLLREAGFSATTIEHCADSAEELSERLTQLAASHDAVITTGGVGPGRHDVVRIALSKEPQIRSVRVAVRPGQPQCSGRHRAGAFVFGLPGNPVSAAVSFELFVRPALRKLAGHTKQERQRFTATVEYGWSGKNGRLQVLPVTLRRGKAGLLCSPAVAAQRVSHSVGQHGLTDGYALVESERGDVAEGETVDVILAGAS